MSKLIEYFVNEDPSLSHEKSFVSQKQVPLHLDLEIKRLLLII